MREIIKTLIKEGIETEDIVTITKYLLEEYNISEGDIIDFNKKKRVHDAQKKVDEIASKALELMNKHASHCRTNGDGIMGPPEHVTPLVELRKQAIVANKELEDAKKDN